MGLFGGSSETSQQGYGALTQNQRLALMNTVAGKGQFIDPYTYNPVTKQREVNQANIDRFTPMGETADETQAYSLMRQGFTPDQARLNSDIALQMNPYDTHVIDEINRQGTGQYSILKQAMNEAGQLGSNRQMLGANDIDLSRMNQIGAFKQQGYANALNNALTVMPTLRQNDASNLAGIGTAQRALSWDTQQAPVNAINAATGVLQGTGLSTAMGNTAFQQNKSSGGIGSVLGGLGSLGSGLTGASSLFGGMFGGGMATGLGGALGSSAGLGSAISGAMMFSDRRLKTDIEPIGKENGHNVYKFKYSGMDKNYIGVMADEVMKTNPDAVKEFDGFYAVDYSKIGVNFREVQ